MPLLIEYAQQLKEYKLAKEVTAKFVDNYLKIYRQTSCLTKLMYEYFTVPQQVRMNLVSKYYMKTWSELIKL